MYYILFQILIQEHFVLYSITCVNSMEVSYIPIAKARGFTTHWISWLRPKLQMVMSHPKRTGMSLCLMLIRKQKSLQKTYRLPILQMK